MIPGSKGLKSDEGLHEGGFLTLGPAKNMSKKPFLEEKMSGLRISCFATAPYERADRAAVFYIHKTGTGLIYVNNRPDMQNPPTR